jgi:hypothetical protein
MVYRSSTIGMPECSCLQQIRTLVAQAALYASETSDEFDRIGGAMLTTPDKRLALQAYEQVLDLIMSGETKPGTVIQERRLAEHLQMSRTPLRDGAPDARGRRSSCPREPGGVRTPRRWIQL